MVPINCENSSARCLPATYEERKQVSGLVEGGLIKVAGKEHGVKDEDEPLEYLLAHFGTKITHEDTTMSTVVARPAEACGPIENDVKGKAVLVRRGGCPFVKKAEEVQAAGGRVIMLGNLHPHIVRMGVEPRWKGLNTVIPVVMISKRVYGILVAESMAADNFEIAFSEDIRVGGKTWETLEKLSNGEGWPRSDSYVEKKYNELKVEHADWPDRIGTLEDAYQKKIKKTAAAAAGSAAGSDKSEL